MRRCRSQKRRDRTPFGDTKTYAELTSATGLKELALTIDGIGMAHERPSPGVGEHAASILNDPAWIRP